MARDITQTTSFKGRQLAKHLANILQIDRTGMFDWSFARGYCRAHEEAEGIHENTYWDEVKPLLIELSEAHKRNDSNHINMWIAFCDYVSPSRHVRNWSDGTFEDLFSNDKTKTNDTASAKP